jgi:SagB-type dehydrogenase family enzyme
MDRSSPFRLATAVVAAAIVSAAAVCISAGRPAAPSPLPAPARQGKMSLEAALAGRRSVRKFANRPLSRPQVSQLCWAAQGVNDPQRGLRTCPSAGALYPLELYVVTRDGVERYVPAGHAMAKHLAGDMRGKLQAAALRQSAVGEAPATFVIAAVVSRTSKKYGRRAQRYVLLEAGHAAQNLLLQATALGLGGVPIGAFEDQKVRQVLSLPANTSPLYVVPVGVPARGSEAR